MKLVLIGAGSFVFAPTVLRDAFEKNRLNGLKLALVDLDQEAAELLARAARSMAEDLGLRSHITATDDRHQVLSGADFVILCASPEGARRWTMDYEILRNAGMPDQARECGGLGGLSNALRSISLALAVARDMEELCPGATLLDVTNPMPRVVTAVRRFTRVSCYGFCNAAQRGPTGFEWLSRLLDCPLDALDAVTAGLNHFSWVVSVRDRRIDRDRMGDLHAAIRSGTGAEFTLLRKWLECYGAVGACDPPHVAEFLPFDPDAIYHTHPPFHGDASERARRRAAWRAIGDGTLPWRAALEGGSWEHPADLASALHARRTLRLPMLNLPNDGCLPELPAGVIVEAPASVADNAVRAEPVGPLPGTVAVVCSTVSQVHELVAAGAARGDRRALDEAIAIDPAITDKSAARRALDRMLEAHRDVLTRFQ